jgi:hypothetical protein
MDKEKVFTCGHPARFVPRNDRAFVETDKQLIIERPCAKCKGKNKVAVKGGRIQRWRERRRARVEEEHQRQLNKPVIKKAEPIKLNRQQRRKLREYSHRKQ